MKVILNDHIENLGERGDSVAVKPGYANNYLLPKGLAYPDTPGNRRRFEQEQNRWEEMDTTRRSAAEKLAADLDGVKLAFERRAGEKDVLFGSVNAADIQKELVSKGFDIDRKRIRLESPIKELGGFDVQVHVHREIDVMVPVRVVRPGEDPNAAAPDFVAEGKLDDTDIGEADAEQAAPPVAEIAAEPEEAAPTDDAKTEE